MSFTDFKDYFLLKLPDLEFMIKKHTTLCIHNMEETPNQIIKVFENHDIFIFEELDTNNKKQYYFRSTDVGKVLDIVNIRTSIQNFDEDERHVREMDTSTDS